MKLYRTGLGLGLLILLYGHPAGAADLMPALGKPGQEKTTIRLDGQLAPGSFNQGEGNVTSIRQVGIAASTPIYQSEQESVVFSGQYRLLQIEGQIRLPQPPGDLAPDFYDIQFGLTYTRAIEKDRFWTVNLNFGSASDRPFGSWNEDIISSTASYRFSDGEKSHWALLVNYSNNRPILNNIPLPGFAYTYKPSASFVGTFGAPFATVFWMPSPKWMITCFALIPWMVKAEVGYFILGPVRLFAGFDFSQQLFLNQNRLNTRDRLFFDSKKVSFGFKSPLSRQIMATINGGYAFNRSFFEGRNYSDIGDNQVTLANTWFTELGFSLSF